MNCLDESLKHFRWNELAVDDGDLRSWIHDTVEFVGSYFRWDDETKSLEGCILMRSPDENFFDV